MVHRWQLRFLMQFPDTDHMPIDSHIWAMWECAAQQSVVFASLSLDTGSTKSAFLSGLTFFLSGSRSLCRFSQARHFRLLLI